MPVKYDIDKILDRLNLEVVSVSGSERYLCCPFHQDSDPSFSINSETGLWICFAGCGEGNLFKFVQNYLGLKKNEVKDWLAGSSIQVTTTMLRKKFQALCVEEKAKTIVPSYWNENMLKPYYKYPLPAYLSKRGFTEETLQKWGVGYHKSKKELVLPVYSPDGKLLGVVNRSIKGHRYSNSLGMDKSQVLFGSHLIVGLNSVWVVEGPLDAMWCSQYNIPAVALLGCSMSESQAKMLVEHHRVISLCFDNDEAGRHGVEAAKKKLRRRVGVREIRLPHKYKDVQEVVGEKLIELYQGHGGHYDI
jgi:DNA primase